MARKPNAIPPKSDLKPEDNEDELVVVEAADDGETLVNGTETQEIRTESEVSLEEQLRAANERATKAEQAAEELRQRTARQEGDLKDTRVQLIERALGEATAENADIRRQIIEAKQAGNYEAEVELISKLQEVNLKISTLNRGKVDLEAAVEMERNAPSDPVERYVSQMQPRAAAWVRAHPEVVQDKAKNEDLTAAHYRALGQRLIAGTDAYFEYLEAELGYREKPEVRTEQRQERQEPQRQNNGGRPPPAPVRGGGGASEGGLPDGVTRLSNGGYKMTPKLIEAARISGISPSEYLKQMLAMHEEQRRQSIN